MITLFCENFNYQNEKEFENSYCRLIDNLNIPLIQCSCKNIGCLSIHAYYTRCIKTPFGKVKMRILRLICSICNRTHALLPSFIVPYSQISIDDQKDIIKNDTESALYKFGQLDINTLNIIKSNYYNFYRAQLRVFNIDINLDNNALMSKCVSLLKKQFMQIHRGIIICFGQTT